MSRDHLGDPRLNNANAGPSRIDQAGSFGGTRRTLSSSTRADAPHRAAEIGGEQRQGGGRAPSRTTALLREFQLQEQQRRRAIESARPPVAQTMAQVVQLLGASSGVAIGPARGDPEKPVVHKAKKSAQTASKSAPGTSHPAPFGPNRKPTNPVTMVHKSTNPLIFPWPRDQDELRENRVRANKRAREAGMFADDDVPAPRRIGAATKHQRPLRMREPNEKPAKRARTPKVNIDRDLALRIDDEVVNRGPGPLSGSASGETSQSDMDVDEEDPPARSSGPALTTARKTVSKAPPQVARKAARRRASNSPTIASQTSSPSPSPEPSYPARRTNTVTKKVGQSVGVFKAARKVDFIATDSEDESEDSSDDDKSDSSSSSHRSIHQPIGDSEDENELEVKLEEDEDEYAGLRPFGPPELIRLDSPPPITIPLPQIDSEYSANPFPPRLAAALSSLIPAVASLRLHETRQLPFLVRNLRRGFLLRCKALGMSLKNGAKEVSLRVKYQHVDDIEHQVLLRKWKCPICSLHGELPNQGVLASHLEWDHAELFVEWEQTTTNSWTVNILVPELVPALKLPDGDHPQEEDVAAGSLIPHDTSMDVDIPTNPRPVVPTNRRETLFPSVTLSPPASARPSPSSSVEPARLPPVSVTPETSASPAPASLVSPTPFGDIKGKGKQRMYYQPTPSTTTPSARGQSTTATGTSTTGRSTTSGGTARMLSTAFVGPDGKRYPTPPPPDDPLGPSARKPYLPAEPLYPGGQTVYYSCRPGGATLYDLLNTLPMEPYGILDWAVLDREEEIFESDEVKDEYKVMHALWARWIFLNRTKFLSNYYKGTTSFIEDYWKMIHRAAGWDALRYWLLILLANRFLAAKEVATLLKRYEAYTGMDHWKE